MSIVFVYTGNENGKVLLCTRRIRIHVDIGLEKYAEKYLRRNSCHGKNHSHTRCEYSETIFLCYHHYSEYSLLGSNFSTNLLFAASKCHVTIQRHWQFKMFKMAEGSDGCSGETLLAPCTRKKRLQRKMAKDNYWIAVKQNIDMFGKS